MALFIIKKNVSISIRHLLAVSALLCSQNIIAQGTTFSFDGLVYQTINDINVRIGTHKGGNGTAVSYGDFPTAVTSNTKKDLVIPSLVKEIYIPIEIDSYALCSSKSGLTSVVMPNTIKEIKDNSFSYNNNLAWVYIPGSVTKLGNAFKECNSLRHIVSMILNPSDCGTAFSNIATDAHLYVPEGTLSKYKSKKGWKSINCIAELNGDNIIFHKSDTGITEYLKITDQEHDVQFGTGAFAAIHNGVSSFTIPESIEHDNKEYHVNRVAANAFKGCSNLEELRIQKNIKCIEPAFEGCSNLKSVYVEWRNPSEVEITPDCFIGISDETVLYVPAGTKKRYENAEQWNSFPEIREISSVSIEDLVVNKGMETFLPISLNDKKEIAGIQFKLTLPDGVSVVEGDGMLVVTPTNRTEGITFMGRKDPDEDNSYLFVAFSLDGNPISGIEGKVMNIKVNVDSCIPLGKYDMTMEDVIMTTTAFETVYPLQSTSELSITDIMIGDVNCDRKVDTQDAILVIQKYLGEIPEGFINGAADVNGDGIIDTQDAILMIESYLNNN